MYSQVQKATYLDDKYNDLRSIFTLWYILVIDYGEEKLILGLALLLDLIIMYGRLQQSSL